MYRLIWIPWAHQVATAREKGDDSVIMEISVRQTTSCRGLEAVRGGLRVYVCGEVSMCIHMQNMRLMWGDTCSYFPFLGSSKHLLIPLPHSLSLSFTICLYRSTWSQEMGGSYPKVSSIHTHTCLHRLGHVFHFCLSSAPADTGDSWSLAMCK